MASESSCNLLLDLPGGVLRQVLRVVSATNTVSLVCTCKHMRDVASEDVVWEPKFRNWHYRSARWQSDERPWIAKYGARKEVRACTLVLSLAFTPLNRDESSDDNAVHAGHSSWGNLLS